MPPKKRYHFVPPPNVPGQSAAKKDEAREIALKKYLAHKHKKA